MPISRWRSRACPAKSGAAPASKYRNTGQTCVCANRILVQDGVYDAFTKRLAETAGAMKVAGGLEPGAVIGPLIDMAVEKVEAHIADAVKKGAKVVTGGKRAAQGGSFFEPTVLTDVTTDMVITKEETFGPVAPLYRFKSEADAVKMANDTEFGLASYFYSRDIGRIWRVAEALEYGIVGINEGIISTEIAPFGGMKESGIGRKAQNTASRSSSRSNTSAWAASTAKNRRIVSAMGLARALSPIAYALSSRPRVLPNGHRTGGIRRMAAPATVMCCEAAVS
jgi:acyl-CoA reductase-like NAD-dependent aldehyde dehydrogenase